MRFVKNKGILLMYIVTALFLVVYAVIATTREEMTPAKGFSGYTLAAYFVVLNGVGEQKRFDMKKKQK